MSLRCGVPSLAPPSCYREDLSPILLCCPANTRGCGGVWWHDLVPQTLGHVGQPPASRTVASHQLYVAGGLPILGVWKSKEQGDGFNPLGLFPPAWSHLTGT